MKFVIVNVVVTWFYQPLESSGISNGKKLCLVIFKLIRSYRVLFKAFIG